MTAEDPGVPLDALLEALQGRGIPLPFEMGTFLVLEVCEQVARSPRPVTASAVRLDDDGQVRVAEGGSATDEEACRALVQLLADLLVRSAPGVPPPLLELVERGPSAGDWLLASLRDELEASLVPLNRAATRRVLARIVREGQRDDAGSAKRVSSPPQAREIDAELDGVLGGAPEASTPAPAPVEQAGAGQSPEPEAATEPARHAPLSFSDDAASEGGLAEFERVASSQGAPGAMIALGVALVGALAVAAYFLLGR